MGERSSERQDAVAPAAVMRIRITRACPAAIDGFAISSLAVGRVYAIKEPVARFLIATGCAEPYEEDPEDANAPRSRQRHRRVSAR